MNGLQQLEKPNIIWVVLGEQDDFMKKGSDEERLRQNCFFLRQKIFYDKNVMFDASSSKWQLYFFILKDT